ncbi:hypothetical protein KAFR_0C01300 [Kazachstania africana CBS 2517]|uniref:Histone H2A/H2B/H3 domain-containing protein n=1 Tax=Kazachstania africana (strain ATCC 22294 / BCRC 22015 / CBS 2517 / CECT 1963 / NBRC 1671 / NRRL Y-8276) TaxID=1071382 RepID=H2ARX3_KAZAF|nr:hypothetical protein KAFR_0C01300 [Kazachstania africana CBS 2517]CCF57123.1 hypothetical protein KAFR_0C01300 [Kazachstania africana CBS 2517]
MEPELKAKLWYHIDIMLKERFPNVELTPRYINAMVEIVYGKLQEISTDLKSFALHDSNRTTINQKDLQLYLRHCPQLIDKLIKEA